MLYRELLSNSKPRDIPEGIENICPHNSFYKNVHISIITNGPKLETTQNLSTDEWIGKKCDISIQ